MGRDAPSLLPVRLGPSGQGRTLQFGHFGEVMSRKDFKFSWWEIFFAGLENPLRVMSPENGAIIHSGSQGRSKGSGVDPRN